MKKSLLFILVTVLGISAFAQHDIKHCGLGHAQDELYKNNPELRAEHEAIQRAAIKKAQLTPALKRDEILVIPIVFHIIHRNGPENITFQQVEDCIKWMNDEFNAQNSKFSTLYSEFVDVAGAMDIEFRLATIDPDGNCTNGVMRYYDERTAEAGEQIKSGRQWPNNMYLNVYVVENIASGAAGYAYYPGTAPSSRDGIVITHSYVGNTGTGSAGRASALTHEVGHYLNLPHVWGSSNTPGLESNCNSDDGIEDTPNTIGNDPATGCNLTIENCGSLDNVQNFMDYAYCYVNYTMGQKAVMRAALNSSTSGRNNLWTQENREATGTVYPRDEMPKQVCKVEFYKTEDVDLCPGSSVRFVNNSSNGDLDYSWEFPGGTPATSTAKNPDVVYSTPGKHDVTLTISDGVNTKSLTMEDYVTVVNTDAIQYPFSDNLREATLDGEGAYSVINEDDDRTWEKNTEVGYDDNDCFSFNNYRVFGSGKIDEIVGATMNNDGIGSFKLSFRYAYAEKSSSGNDDKLRIMVSKDCGETWATRRTLKGSSLITADQTTSEFVPSSQEEWGDVSVTLSGYDVEGFRFKIRFENGGGNNIYIDDINIANSSVGVGELDADAISVYPNPANESFKVDGAKGASFKLYSITGQLVNQGTINNTVENINLSNLHHGVYTLELTSNGSVVTKKIIKQ